MVSPVKKAAPAPKPSKPKAAPKAAAKPKPKKKDLSDDDSDDFKMDNSPPPAKKKVWLWSFRINFTENIIRYMNFTIL